MKLFALIISFFLCLQTHAQNRDADTPGLIPFKQAIGASRIVGLGESGHGYKTINEAKSVVLTTLQRDLGFKAVLFESSFTLSIVSFLMDSALDSRTKHFLYPFWNTASVKSALTPFLQKEHNEPLITGFDIQEDCRFTRLTELLIGMNIIVENQSRLLQCDSILAYYIGENFSRKHPLSNLEYLQLIRHYEIIQEEINRKGKDVLRTKLLQRCITNRLWLFKYLTFQSAKERMHYRDSLMAQNISWLQQEVYKQDKIVLWSADTHIAKNAINGQNPSWMGEWLHRIYGQNYYAISFRKGSAGTPFLRRDTFANYANDSNEKIDLTIGVGSLVKVDPSEWMTSCD